ncbi:DUF4350 domain-containing protein [Neobacillus soli]|uniref:DUF4350 domain-containing protein n=1 Tax=Neobacillus soli TaxID=220688 RepID=UPI00082417C4|nr:DUF4350 domain-containing protein [Neobacillus soli]
MKKLQSNRQGWIWIAILLFLFIVISFSLLSQKPKAYPNYVSDSPSPTGVKAFYTYLNKVKDVNRWDHSPNLFQKSHEKKLLVMVEPAFIPDKKEMDAYIDFMKDGNTILLFKDNPKGMFDLNTGPFEETPSFTKDELKVYDQNHKAFMAEISSPIRLIPNKQDQILFKDDAGLIALKRTFGNGQLIVTITPEWIINSQLLDEDHLPLILKLINESKASEILFDEYVHDGQNAAAITTLYPKWFLLLLLQGILLVILWLWYKGKRFGPIIVPRDETVRFSDEGIRALTAWYLRGKRYHDSLLIQADYAKLLLQERWQIPYSRDWKDLASYLERKWLGIPRGDIRPFLNGLSTIMEKEKISKQEYLLWSRKLDQLRKEVEEG